MSNKARSTEVIIDVTEEEYQADLAKGLQEDEVLKPGRHTFRRGNFLARHGLSSEDIPARVKIRISINLDLDVLNYFKQRAAQPNAAPYQTQINNVLREVMEMDSETTASSLAAQTASLLADERFIEAVAERVQAHLPQLAGEPTT
jgi:uncharacterized protein (DUF4415 family)